MAKEKKDTSARIGNRKTGNSSVVATDSPPCVLGLNGRESTKKAKVLFLEALKNHAGNVTAACEAANIARAASYVWMDNDPAFAQAVADVREGLIDNAECKLQGLVNAGELGAICFFLKTQGKKRGYVERQEVDHSGSMSFDVKVTYE